MSVRYPDSSGQQCQAGGQETWKRSKYVKGMRLPWFWDWFGSGKTINRDYCVEIFPKGSSAVSKRILVEETTSRKKKPITLCLKAMEIHDQNHARITAYMATYVYAK